MSTGYLLKDRNINFLTKLVPWLFLKECLYFRDTYRWNEKMPRICFKTIKAEGRDSRWNKWVIANAGQKVHKSSLHYLAYFLKCFWNFPNNKNPQLKTCFYLFSVLLSLDLIKSGKIMQKIKMTKRKKKWEKVIVSLTPIKKRMSLPLIENLTLCTNDPRTFLLIYG